MKAGTRIAAAVMLLPSPLVGQGFLEQFSYEGLRLSGITAELGTVVSDRLTTELTPAVRVDYGYIAPKVRVVIGGSYFKGEFNVDEIAQFETQLRGIVDDPTGDFTVDVGAITLADFEASLDLQYVFRPDAVVIPYIGLGLSVHIRDGDGPAIQDTFVEDALDTIAAGATLSFGAEFALSSAFRLTLDVRGGLTSELRTASARGGLMYRIPIRAAP